MTIDIYDNLTYMIRLTCMTRLMYMTITLQNTLLLEEYIMQRGYIEGWVLEIRNLKETLGSKNTLVQMVPLSFV